MSLIRKTFRIGDVLTNMTSVNLSSSGAVFGVKRNDTDAVVVADGTAMTNVSTGVYEYEFTDPDYDLTYTYSLEVTYGGETYWIEGTIEGPEAPAGAAGSAEVAANIGQITYYDLIERVSDYLGYGLAPSGDGLARVRMAIAAGYSRFVNPPVLPEETVPHEWSWLSPLAPLELSEGVYRYTLPYDFEGVINDITYGPQVSQVRRIGMTSEGIIRKLRANADTQADPYCAAVRALSYSKTSGQLWELVVYPTPTQDRTVYYRYRISGTKLDTAIVSGTGSIIADANGVYNTLYDPNTDFSGITPGDVIVVSAATGPLEGMYVVESVCPSTPSGQSVSPSGASASGSASPSGSSGSSGCHTVVVVGDCETGGTLSYEILPKYIYPRGECPECLVESCLHQAELLQNDEIGIHYQKFMELLIACVQRDRMKHSQELGYCGDDSDMLENGVTPYHEVTGVTVNGVTP